MIKRDAASSVVRLAASYSLVTVTGPRQSGKSTLCRAVFPDKPYLSLEAPDVRQMAREDPRGFLARFPDGALLDEIQRVPELLSYIQGIVDASDRRGMYILTGSANLALVEGLNQSLAGRTALVTLLPFSLAELSATPFGALPLTEFLYRGFYPRIYDQNLNPTEALRFYTSTYVERDVRTLLNVRDLVSFENFVRLCAARSGQVLNLSNLAADCGITHNTARAWLSLLEAAYLVHRLPADSRNYTRRITKAPKLVFCDVGLMGYLLGIEHARQVQTHPLRGAMFETLVIGELLKMRLNAVRDPHLTHYRDSSGREIDVILQTPSGPLPIEIKSAMSVAADAFAGLDYYGGLLGRQRGVLVYGGDESYEHRGYQVLSFRHISRLAELD
jgi:predicted AAA+ superfamily ATPase